MRNLLGAVLVVWALSVFGSAAVWAADISAPGAIVQKDEDPKNDQKRHRHHRHHCKHHHHRHHKKPASTTSTTTTENT